MNDIMRDVTGILMAVVGVALLFVVVSPSNKTAQVVQAGSSGFAQVLATAMGGNMMTNVPVGFTGLQGGLG